MPACRPLEGGVYEVRTGLSQNRIGRVLFYIDKLGRMVLLHGFIKKTRRTPAGDLARAARVLGKSLEIRIRDRMPGRVKHRGAASRSKEQPARRAHRHGAEKL
jgi:hypothetical protein